MKLSISRAERFIQEESIILTHPGIKRTDLAKKIGVHRSTVSRDIDELSILYPLSENENGGLFFEEGYSLDSITFTSHEAVYVYLACKLITDTLDRHSPYAASAMRKLGIALEKISPSLSSVMKNDADRLEGNRQINDKPFLAALERITQGWIKHEKVRIEYNSPSDKKVKIYNAGIVRILPNRLGGTFVVLTYQTDRSAFRLFRIDRIKKVILLGDPFRLPENIDINKKLDEAWSIWYKDTPPEHIKLKFSPEVADRVVETRWHPSQKTKRINDGSLIADFEVSEPKEMYPWIRGWGKDVEIVEPDYLRRRFIGEIREMGKKYGI